MNKSKIKQKNLNLLTKMDKFKMNLLKNKKKKKEKLKKMVVGEKSRRPPKRYEGRTRDFWKESPFQRACIFLPFYPLA